MEKYHNQIVNMHENKIPGKSDDITSQWSICLQEHKEQEYENKQQFKVGLLSITITIKLGFNQKEFETILE